MDEIDNQTYLTVAEAFATECLRELVRLDQIDADDVNGKWYVTFDNEDILEKQGLVASVTIGNNSMICMYLSSRRRLSFEGLKHAIAHESVHVAQMCKGDLVPKYGYCVWKGINYDTLPSIHPDYFELQPWENEAKRLQPVLIEHLTQYVTRIAPGRSQP